MPELRDLAPGLWIWRLTHPDWRADAEWSGPVTSTCVESRGEVALLDPIAPPEDAREFWDRLDARPPTMVVILKPDHVRDVDLFVRRYGARAFGPWLFWRRNIPETDLEPIEPGTELPGGLVALDDGRGRNETPLFLPEHRTLVFADGLTAPEGELRVWATPQVDRALPALRALLELPFERVIVSHGEPVHDRKAFIRALALPTWPVAIAATPAADRAVPILPSRNLRETLAFYERLGFENRGAPPEQWDYLIVGRGGAELHFYADPAVDPLTTSAGCYLRVGDARALHDEWNAIGVPRDEATGSRLQPPVDTDYGMCEFALVDPSGNLVRVGSPQDA